MKRYNTIVMSDLHAPYHHRDAFSFVKAIKDEYDIRQAAQVGDMADNHYPSFHEKEPGCYGGSEEIKKTRIALQKLEKIFPEMKISLGNHCILPKRKAKAADVPLEWVAQPNEVYQLQGGWDWQPSHMIKYTKELEFLLIHSVGANTRANAQKFTHSSVQGHHHSEFCIAYEADTLTLRWAMSVGCLIDHHSPAFHYDKNRVTKRPILGCGVVINGTPLLIPMILTKSGRWNRKLPI